MGILVHTKIQLFQKETGAPLTGNQYYIELYDKDVLTDDLLGKAFPDEQGNVLITFDIEAIQSADSPMEQYPDLYFKVYQQNKLIFQSNVLPDLDTLNEGSFSFTSGKVINLGKYLI